MRISKRLKLISDMVQSGSKVCDVGTDHGYLSAFLYKSGKCLSVCATDIREKPLNKARRNLSACGADDVNLYLCDGLDVISRDMADTVIIAGIGGEVISGIIDRALFLRDETVSLILQPTTGAGRLRDYLAGAGFVVVCEKAVEDNERIYSVMKCHFGGISYPIDSLRRTIGLIRPDYPEGKAYIKKQYIIAQRRADELKNTGKNTSCCFESRDIASKLKILLGEGDSNGI
ncbi:MAG: SAM-dependent methyltransferase [Clostridia bacterium]|nr:SAM-dependent methyltransferase [Clostridia bacterium]